MDHAYLIEDGTGRAAWLLESKSRWESEATPQLAEYSVALALNFHFQVPINPVLVLFAPGRQSGTEPDCFHTRAGRVGVEIDFLLVRLWEVDARKVLDSGYHRLLPWVPLLGGGQPELQEAAEKIVATGDKSLASSFCTLGGLRYDKVVLEHMLERLHMFIPKELFDEGPAYIEVRAEGKAEGQAQGRADAARESLRHLLARKFPELLSEAAALDSIQDANRLMVLFDGILDATSVEQARRVFQSL